MKFIERIPAWLRNKYGLTLLIFTVWLAFFDHNDLLTQIERTSELRKLEKSKAYYTGQIEAIRTELAELDNDPASLEKAAREKFLMKRDSEDVFIIDEK